MISSFGNARKQYILLHVILPAAAHLGERGTTVGALQERTETQRYWMPGGCSFCLSLFFNAVALHRIEATRRDARCDDAYEFREALNFYEAAYHELAYPSSILHTHTHTTYIYVHAAAIASCNTLMWNRSVSIRSFVISFIGNR